LDVRRQFEIGYLPICRWLGRLSGDPSVDEVENANRENEEERADEQPRIKVQIANDQVEAISHLALLYESGMRAADMHGEPSDLSLSAYLKIQIYKSDYMICSVHAGGTARR
jgi:hypothetical protein